MVRKSKGGGGLKTPKVEVEEEEESTEGISSSLTEVLALTSPERTRSTAVDKSPASDEQTTSRRGRSRGLNTSISTPTTSATIKTELISPTPAPTATPTTPATATTSKKFELTDAQCLNAYNELETAEDFVTKLKKSDQEKIVRGALKANGGPISCMSCDRQLSSSLGLVLHIRKCAESLKKKDALDGRGRPSASGTVPLNITSFQQLKDEPSIWMKLIEKDKEIVLRRLFPEEIKCFGRMKKGDPPCPTFRDVAKAIKHIDKCIIPMYFTFIGPEGAREFRALDKKLRGRYVREAMKANKEIPCFECGRLFKHHYGLVYHLERCNVDDEEKPWKCYKCGIITHFSNKMTHLIECAVESRSLTPEFDSRDRRLVMGTLGDVNLRSGKTVLKGLGGSMVIDGVPQAFENINAADALTSLLGADAAASLLTPSKRRIRSYCPASVSHGYIPSNSARSTINETGQKRFKFRKVDANLSYSDIDWPKYQQSIVKTQDAWASKMARTNICDRLVDIQPDTWIEVQQKSNEYLEREKKKSVSFRIHNEHLVEYTTSIPTECQQLNAFQSMILEGAERNVSVGYAAGPIIQIRYAPNPYDQDEEVLAVATYPCEKTLVGKNWKSANALTQLWIVKQNKEDVTKSTMRLWFTLQSTHGQVLNITWLDRPKTESQPNLIGYLALSTAQGTVLIYRIDTMTVSEMKSPPLVQPIPHLTLRQGESLPEMQGREDVEESFYPPLHTMTWPVLMQGIHLFAINAAGSILMWDLTKKLDEPILIHDKDWTSPACDIAAFGESYVAVAFREKCIRVFDIQSWNCVMEEKTVRTAGARIISQPSSFPGLVTFQAEYVAVAEGNVPMIASSYISIDSDAYFIVPLASRHELMMWDACQSPLNGSVSTVGLDGRLLLSANGRMVPNAGTSDYSFSILKTSLVLTRRKRNVASANETKEENEDDIDCNEHESTVENMWLDVAVDKDMPLSSGGRKLEFSTVDLRIESLNAVSQNKFGLPMTVCGGQAGLLFLRSAKIKDPKTSNSTSWLDMFAFANKTPLSTEESKPKKKRRR